MQASSGTSVRALDRPIVERPRLTRLLDRANARIVLLTAPAGYGKTTLARQWLRGRRHAWYACTAASSDVAGLAAGIADQIVAILPELERPLQMHLRVAAQAPDQLEYLVEVMVEHLEFWPDDTVLAVDDYHLIARSSASEALLASIIERTRISLLITARQRPSWASARAVLYGDLYELDQAALSITRAEAAKFLTGKAAAIARELAAISRGWPAILSLASHADPRLLPRRSAPLPSWIGKFIQDELLSTMSSDGLYAAVTLSSIENWEPSLLAAIDGHEWASLLLEEMTSHGLVVTALDPDKATRELHPLVRAYLLGIQFPHKAERIARALVSVLISAGRWDDAFAVSMRSAQMDLAEDVLRHALHPLLLAGRQATVERWAGQLARSTATPLLDLCKAEIASRSGAFLEAESLATHAASCAPTDEWIKTHAQLIAGRSAHLSHHDMRAAEYFLSASALAPNPDLRREAQWGLFVASSATGRASNTALRELLESETDTSPKNRLRHATAAYALGRAQASMFEALEFLELAAPITHKVRDPLVLTSFLHAHSSTLAMAARYRRSLEVLDRAISIARSYRIMFALSHLYVTQAVAQGGLRLFDAARVSLHQARDASRDPTAKRFVELNATAAEARICLMEGDAERGLALSRDRWSDVPDSAMRAELQATSALALAVTGDSSGSQRAIREARAHSSSIEPVSLCLACEAALASQQGADSREVVLERFRQVVAMNALDSIVVAYRSTPSMLSILVTPENQLPAFLELIDCADDISIAEIAGIHRAPPRYPLAKPRPYSLTSKENEVCDLLVIGLSNRELASRLFITEATVKLHLRHIYAKLGAKNRTEAVIKLLRERPLGSSEDHQRVGR